MEKRVFNVGDDNYTIEPFRGSKGIRILNAVARLGETARPVIDQWNDYDRQYRESHSNIITRELAEVRRAQSPDEETRAGWERLLVGPLKEREQVTIPLSPTFEQKMIAFFPQFFAMAEEEVVRLLALILIPNREMKEARRSGQLEERLQALGEEMLDEMDLPQLAEVAVAAVEAIREQFQGTSDRLGKLRSLLDNPQLPRTEATAMQDDRETTPRPGGYVGEETTPPSNDSSSTASPSPTDGAPNAPSSESPGPISATSGI